MAVPLHVQQERRKGGEGRATIKSQSTVDKHQREFDTHTSVNDHPQQQNNQTKGTRLAGGLSSTHDNKELMS